MEKETPLISFIITTYNLPPALIEECVNSVMAIPLTAGEREVIVIDDGSDPPALEVLSDHRDDMIYVRQPNGGLSSARNRGLDMARGTYIQFVDGDDHDVLYFVSDRKQSVGGLDIWYSIHKDGHYQTPVNVGGSINTEGNEVTPFYDRQNGVLYFSSDEHLGIGDYDIFYCQGALNRWGEVSNMGVPFNSGYNDFYFNLNTDGKSGYLSSNRPHDGMDDSDTCCNDLFHFHWVIPEDTVVPPPAEEPDIQTKIASVLPIILYFQNDQPDPRSISDTTVTDYPELYTQYMSDNALYVRETGQAYQAICLTRFWTRRGNSLQARYVRLSI